MIWLITNAVDAFFPGTDTLPSASEAGAAEKLRKMRREAPPLMWLGFVASALAFHLLPPFTVFVPLPACWLPAGLRDKHANRLASSRWYLIRQVSFLLKTAGGMCWASDARVLEALGRVPYPEDPGTWRTT